MSKPSEHTVSLIELAKSSSLHRGRFKDFIQELLPFLSKSLEADRSTIWLYRSKEKKFESIQSCDSRQINQIQAFIDEGKFPTVFEKLETNHLLEITMDDADNEQFIINYLVKKQFKTWISVQIWNNRKLFGIISLEWKTKRDFTDKDRLTLITTSSMISQCYDALLRMKEGLVYKNELDTLKEEELEKKKLEKKLADHAFYTSHNIRHPLSTIMALVDLIKLNWDNRESYEELLQQLKIETMNLDETIRVMTAKIELD